MLDQSHVGGISSVKNLYKTKNYEDAIAIFVQKNLILKQMKRVIYY